MTKPKQYLIDSWYSLILIGETKLWFTGAVGSLGMIGMFSYVLVSTVSTVSYTTTDWFFAIIIVVGLFPFILTLFFGYSRKILKYPSIKKAREFEYIEFYKVMGMVWLLNIVGIIFLFVLLGFVLQFAINYFEIFKLAGK